jgi:hypothetical protein
VNMKNFKSSTVLFVSLLALTGCSASPEAGPTPDNSLTPAPTQTQELPSDIPPLEDAIAGVADEDVSDVEVLWEALMGADGEYAAAASYQSVLDEYGQVEPYATILQAELRHSDALIRQLERLGTVVPTNPYTGQIPAPRDLQSAAEAWAEGEVLNIEMYDALIGRTSDSQILKVLGNLRRASQESHLPAFQQAAENGGTLDSMPQGQGNQ